MNWKENLKELSEKTKSTVVSWGVRDRIKGILPSDFVKKMPSSFDPHAIMEWLKPLAQQRGFDFFLILITTLLSTLFLSNITAFLADRYLVPDPPATRTTSIRTGNTGNKPAPNLEDYNIISARNLFNKDGIIGGENPEDGGSTNLDNGPPQKTMLPFNLIGTIILKDELRSVAAIEDKSASTVYPVRVEDEIPAKAKILKIEPNKVIFINTSSGRKEFVDIPEDQFQSTARISLGSPRRGGPGIESVSPTQYSVSRSEIDKARSNLPALLTQIKADPYFENGVPAGFRLSQVQPGSIFSSLGIKDGDVLTSVNGEPVTDMAKALELMNQLGTLNHVDIGFKREGRQQTFGYDIR